MANVSSFCTSYGLLILPVFVIGFFASLLWLILAVMKKSTAKDEVQKIHNPCLAKLPKSR
jgi:uncharacterized protein YktB (UPF0637 family)